MTEWSLPRLLSDLHDEIQNKLERARKSLGHPTTKGDASENIWIELFTNYLPARYCAAKAHVVDSNGRFSQQIDVVIFDRQYSPFILQFQEQIVVPAESVYAIFEAKQSLNADVVGYAKEKTSTVRKLYRTSLPIPHAGGTFSAKPLTPIIGGVLAFESDWNPPLGKALDKCLSVSNTLEHLDMGCVAAHGHFSFDKKTKNYNYSTHGKSATAFLFNLISELQQIGTIPMIDVSAYSKWLA